MEHRIRVEGSAWILLALMILLLPLNWVLSAVTAAAIHELCHFLVIRLLGIRVFKMQIGARGTVLETGPMTEGQELLSALAGPAGSLLLLSVIHSLPEVALCGLVQGLYNLLPLLPLDGGRCLSSLLSVWIGAEKAKTWMEWVQRICGILLTCCSIFLGFYSVPAAALGGILGLRLLFPGKSPCKDGLLGVQ